MNSEKRIPVKRKRRKRAAPAKASAAGGGWGAQFRERLRQVVKAHAASNAAFARECGIQAPRLCEWLAGEQVPSAESFRAIANTFGVSLDWLLDGLNHQGDVSAAPVYRAQWRSSPDVERDFVAVIARELGDIKPIAGLAFRLDTGAVYTAACRGVVQEVHAEIEAIRNWWGKGFNRIGFILQAIRAARVMVLKDGISVPYVMLPGMLKRAEVDVFDLLPDSVPVRRYITLIPRWDGEPTPEEFLAQWKATAPARETWENISTHTGRLTLTLDGKAIPIRPPLTPDPSGVESVSYDPFAGPDPGTGLGGS